MSRDVGVSEDDGRLARGGWISIGYLEGFFMQFFSDVKFDVWG